MLIYVVTNDVNNKLYFGKTTKTLRERILNHKRSCRAGTDNHFYRAVRKYGWKEFYIWHYDTIKNGYNMAKGGEFNAMDSDVIKERHDAKMRTPEVRKKISESMKAYHRKNGGITEEHRRHLSENKKAFYASERGQETKRKFRETYHLSEAHYRALNDAKNKALYCINESGTVVAEFSRVTDASTWWQHNGYGEVRYLRTISGTIKRSATENRYIKGLKWIYRV